MLPPDLVPRSSMSVPAIRVDNANKTYGKNLAVLNNLCMEVQQGTIYGLLGSSGCGKTTLLSCIVGLKRLDFGEISVFGECPKNIVPNSLGYQPQDIALYGIFSIEETMQYFGQIYGMTHSEIKERTAFLADLLKLPDTKRLIHTLSGGQQRRVSFAAAMIHQPQLLILDEPTVGMDPLLRESIWNYLLELVSVSNITAILTTHYIDEARNAHKVGLMRYGHLLAEDKPENLLKMYDASLLEDVVLKLCKMNKSPNKTFMINKVTASQVSLQQLIIDSRKERLWGRGEQTVVGIKYSTATEGVGVRSRRSVGSASSSLEKEGFAEGVTKKVIQCLDGEYRKTSAVLKRNFLMHFRQPVFILVQLILPTLQIILFNYIMGSEPSNVRVGVVNHELPFQRGSASFMNVCNKKKVNGSNTCFGEGLICTFFDMFQKDEIEWYPMISELEARESVQNGDTIGYISIPNSFTAAMQDKLVLKQFASNDTLEASMIRVTLDYSNKLSTGFLTKNLYEKYLSFLQEVVAQCGQNPGLVKLPLKLTSIGVTKATGWAEFFQPAFILWIIFLISTGMGIFYVADVKAGTMERTIIAGVEYRHFLMAALISEGLTTILQLSLCVMVLLFGFNFHVVGSLPLCFLISFLTGMVGVSLGLLFGSICREEMEVIMAVNTIYMITVPACGGVWPSAAIVPWYRTLSYFLPVTIPLESLRSVVNRGWGLDHPVVYNGIVVLMGWILGACILSGLCHRMRIK